MQRGSFRPLTKNSRCVTLSGTFNITTSRGEWSEVGDRASVFAGIAHTLYLPRRTEGVVATGRGGEFAVARAPSSRDHEPFLVRPQDVKTFIRGGDNATRQINQLIPPGAPVERLVVVEVYTPAGSWSSFPPHKHDVHRADAQGELIEADLEEVYFYQDRPAKWLRAATYLHRSCFAASSAGASDRRPYQGRQ